MRRCFTLVLTTMAVLGLSGCGGSGRLAPSAQDVRLVTQRDLVAGCEYLGPVTGSSALGGIAAQRAGKARSENEMRNKAARLGGNVVLVHSSRGGFNGAESVGDAYRCGAGAVNSSLEPAPALETPVPEAPAGGGGCVKDTDCKGSRICESGRCVNP